MQSRLDAPTIDDAILNLEPLTIEFVNEYAGSLDATTSIVINDLLSGDLASLKTIIDLLTIEIENDALLFNLSLDGKSINLEDSYIRNIKDTSGVLTPIANGTPLIVRFEIPGFDASKTYDLTLFYNQAFNPAEITELEVQLGIFVTGNGAKFTFRNEAQCKVNFLKPITATESYVIINEAQNIIFEI
jgi:hypothetical protein